MTVALVCATSACAAAQEGPLLDPATKPMDLAPRAAAKPARAAPAPRTKPATEKAQDKAVETAKPAASPAPVAESKPSSDEQVLAQYCKILSGAASEGRAAWQAKQIAELEEKLRARIAELDAKRVEVEGWLRRREEAQRQAEESIVSVYSRMKPDAAAAQFSAMDESGAAAILARLNPRFAGSVLNEIDAPRAARIAAEMAGVPAPRRELARSVRP